MEPDSALNNLILEILMANEKPLTQDEICVTITDKGLFDFDKSSLDGSDLSAYAGKYLEVMVQFFPDHMIQIPSSEYVYTPRRELLPSIGASIRSVHFKGLQLNKILKGVDNKDPNKIAFLSALKIAADQNISGYLNIFDSRVRYAILVDMIEMESDVAEREGLIIKALTDPNTKIKTAAISYVDTNSSDPVKKHLCDVMDDYDLYSYAQAKAFNFRDDIVYSKYLELAKSSDFEMAKLPAQILFHGGYATILPSQLKILEYWDDYKENFEALGFMQPKLESYIVGRATNYNRLPRKVKDSIITYCNSTDLNLQNKAMQCMEGKWAKSEFKMLESIGTTDNPLSQKLQIQEMARLNASKSLSAAVELIKDPDQFVRNAAIEVVGEHGSEVELLILLDIFKDQAKQDQFDIATLLEAIKKLQGR